MATVFTVTVTRSGNGGRVTIGDNAYAWSPSETTPGANGVIRDILSSAISQYTEGDGGSQDFTVSVTPA